MHNMIKKLMTTPLMFVLMASMVLYGVFITAKDVSDGIAERKNAAGPGPQLAVAQDSDLPKPQREDGSGTGEQGSDDGSSTPGTVPGSGSTRPSRKNYPTYFKTVEMRKARSPYYGDNDKVALTTEYPFSKVDKSYYDDVLFIGDSRIEGLHDYGDIGNATFAFKKGLSVYNAFDKEVSTDGNNSLSLEKVLTDKKFQRVYTMIGINELGQGTTEEYKEKYASIIEEIRKLQPDSTIVIMGIMHVTDKYSEESDVFNNDNIDDRNRAIAELADGQTVFYLDVNPAVEDENGSLLAEYTWDGVHLKAEFYSYWVDFMNMHGFVKR